jgi:hypothetical protein
MANEIDSLIKRFNELANEAAERARKETFDRLTAALGTKPSKPVAVKAKPVGKVKRGRPAKVRTVSVTDDIGEGATTVVLKPGNGGAHHVDELTTLNAIVDAPGQRIDQYAKSLGVPTKELGALAKRLLKSGAIRTEGQRRGTTYHPAGA